MPTMSPAPSKPGHVIMCTDLTQYPPRPEGSEIWLAGCSCGEWSRRGEGPEINSEWEKHLAEIDDGDTPGPDLEDV